MHTRELARFVAGLQYESLPATTVEMAKQCILDTVGICIRGAEEKASVIMRKVVKNQESKPEATVFSHMPFKTTALNAALANGCAMHSLDFDDLHNASIIHLGTVVVPAALAVAEQVGATGRQLILAVVAGYEVGARVGEAVNPESYFFWHTTGTAGTFGAAAAAAKLLQLDTEQTLQCLGSAGTQASGLWEFLKEGAMSKTLHSGKAAMNGILSAHLAKEGFTAATSILEGNKGFCLAMTQAARLEKLTGGLGCGKFKIDENSFKPYACCKHCHSAINAVQMIFASQQQEWLNLGEIEQIHIQTNAVADNLVNNPSPQNAYGSKFSIQYCVAAAIRYGQVGVAEFEPSRLADPELRRLMSVVTVEVDAKLDEDFRINPDRWSVWLSIVAKDGKEYKQFIEYPKGDPQNPVSYAETEDKAKSLIGAIYGEKNRETLLHTIATLEKTVNISHSFDFLFESQ